MNRKTELLILNLALCTFPVVVISLFSVLLVLGLRYGSHGTQWLVPFGLAFVCFCLGNIQLLSAERFNLRNAFIRSCTESSPISQLCFRLIDVLTIFFLALSPIFIFYSLRADYCLVAFDDGLHTVVQSTEFVFFDRYLGLPVLIPSMIFVIALGLLTATSLFSLSRKWQTVLKQSTDTEAVIHALDKLTTVALFYRKLDRANEYSLRLLQALEK